MPISVSRRIKKLIAKMAQLGDVRVLYHGLALAPRLILHVASVAALAGMFAACVPATRFEEVQSASEVELAGRRRAEAALAETRQKLDTALAQLGEREQKLAATEQTVSESKLESSVAVKERDEATGLVSQLRGDLARVGDNLRSYAQEKAELERSLQAAQARKLSLERSEARTVALARLTRDLTSALGDRVTSGDVQLDVKDGRVVLSAPPELWFDETGALRTGMNGVLSAVTRVLALHADSALELSVPGPGSEQRAPALSSALSARGVAGSRVTVRSGTKLAAPSLTEPSNAGAEPARDSAAVELSFSVG